MRYKPELGFFGNLERAFEELTKTNNEVFNTENRISINEETMKIQLAESDEIAIELYEANLAQEAINAEQDEAIIEIYEKMEGTNNG